MSVQRSALNLNGGEAYKEHRYINCVKSAQRPICLLGSGLGYLAITPDAYPTEFTTGVNLSVYIPPSAGFTSTTYVVKWKGNASYSHTSFGVTTPSSRTFGSATWTGCAQNTQQINGRMTFTITGAGGNYSSVVNIKGDGTVGATNRLTDFVICRADEEDAFDGGQVFRSAFLALIAAYRPPWLRFMDAQQTNTSILANWADRPRTTAMTCNYQPYITSKIVSGSANPGEIAQTSANVYSANAYSGMPVTYQHGETVQGHVLVSSSSTTPTLSVGGRGQKTISLPGPLATAGTNYQTQLLAVGTVSVGGHVVGAYTFTYDQFYDQWILWYDAGPMGEAVEDLVALCNATNVGGWFNTPAYASDDYVTQLGNYLVANWSSAGPILIEWVNEIWNFGGAGFPMTTRVAAWGEATFTLPQITNSNGADYSAYYGLRFRQITQILRPIFAAAGKSSLLKMVLASQGSQGNNAATLATVIENLRFQNAAYASISGVNAPITFADYVSYALYHAPTSILGDANDVGWGSITQASTLKGYVDTWIANNNDTTGFVGLHNAWLADAAIQGFFNSDAGRLANWDALAAKYGKQIVHYEFNQEVDAPSTTFTGANAPWSDPSYGGQNGKINQFLLAFFASSQWQDVNAQLLTLFYARSRSLASTIYGMCTFNPWLTFPKLAPLTDPVAGDTTQLPYGNYLAHKIWNNQSTRLFRVHN